MDMNNMKSERNVNNVRDLQAAVGVLANSDISLEELDTLCSRIDFTKVDGASVLGTLKEQRVQCSSEHIMVSRLVYHIVLSTAKPLWDAQLSAFGLKECTISCYHLSQVIKYLFSSRHCMQATALLSTIEKRKTSLDAGVLNTLLKGYLDHNMITSAQEILERFQTTECRPNERTFCIVMSRFAKQGNVKAVQSLFHEACKANITPNVYMFAEVMKAHIASGDVDQAVSVLTTMDSFGCKADVTLYSILLKASFSTKNVALCTKLLEEVRDKGLRLDETALTYLCHKGNKQTRLEILNTEAADLDITGKNNISHASLTAYIKSRSKVYDINTLRLPRSSILSSPRVTNALLKLYASHNKWNNASALYCLMKEHKSANCHTLSILVKYLLVALPQDCEDIFSIVQQLWELQGTIPEITTVNEFLHAFVRAGNVAQIQRILQLLHTNGVMLDDYFVTTLMLGFRNLEQWDKVVDIWNAHYSTPIPAPHSSYSLLHPDLLLSLQSPPSLASLTLVIQSYGHLQNSTRLLSIWKQYSHRFDQRLLVTFAQALVRCGHLQPAAHISSHIMKNGSKALVRSSFLQRLATPT
jgi:pentatricopeptide repeat protein